MVEADIDILNALTQKFDPSLLKERNGFTYIPEPLVRDRLTAVLGFDWDWVILKHELVPFNQENKNLTYYTKERDPREHLQVIVHGSLTIKLPNGQVARRDAFGGSALISGSMAGDAFKAASSNAFKKAAYLFGIGAYLGMDDLESTDDTKNMRPRQLAAPQQLPPRPQRSGKRRPAIPGFAN